MKTLIYLTTILALVAAPALAADSKAKVKAGPRHGRILEFDGVNAEFFVEKDRTVTIAFYDAAGKSQPAGAQVVTATAEAPGAKAKLEFVKKGALLSSTAPLPPGEGYQVVVQAKASAAARPKNFRIKLETHPCKECNNPEYACTCDH